MYCRKCGQILKEEDLYCKRCGILIEKDEVPAKKPRKAWLIVLVILAAAFIIFMTGYLMDNVPLTGSGHETYEIADIEAMLLYDKAETYRFEDVSGSLERFNKILAFADKIVGKDAYHIASIYTVSETGPAYVIQIVPNSHQARYDAWEGGDATNPWRMMFSMKGNGSVSDFYRTILLAEKWEEDVRKAFLNQYGDRYYMNVSYAQLRYISSDTAGLKGENRGSWEEVLGDLSFLAYDMNHINVFVPAETSQADAELLIEELQPFLKKYYIQGLNICVLSEAGTYERIQTEEATGKNYYFVSMDEDIEVIYGYRIDKEGAIDRSRE